MKFNLLQSEPCLPEFNFEIKSTAHLHNKPGRRVVRPEEVFGTEQHLRAHGQRLRGSLRSRERRRRQEAQVQHVPVDAAARPAGGGGGGAGRAENAVLAEWPGRRRCLRCVTFWTQIFRLESCLDGVPEKNTPVVLHQTHWALIVFRHHTRHRL